MLCDAAYCGLCQAAWFCTATTPMSEETEAANTPFVVIVRNTAYFAHSRSADFTGYGWTVLVSECHRLWAIGTVIE
jgi:hypothetical protein